MLETKINNETDSDKELLIKQYFKSKAYIQNKYKSFI